MHNLDLVNIKGIEFYPLSDEELLRNSTVRVENTNQIENNRTPALGGIYDSRMGSQFNYVCTTCGNEQSECPGHYGHYKLSHPVINPIYYPFIIKWLRLICVHCHRIIMDTSIKELYGDMDDFIKSENDYKANAILKYFIKKYKSIDKRVYCDHCNNIASQIKHVKTKKSFDIKVYQPTYKTSSINEFFVRVSRYATTRSTYVEDKSMNGLLLINDQLDILESMPDSELEKIGFPVKSHPKNYINWYLYIPPVMIRFINNSKHTSSDHNYVTGNLEKVIKSDMAIGVVDKFSESFDKRVGRINSTLDNLIQMIKDFNAYIGIITSQEKKYTIYHNIPGKEGFLRKTIIGKTISRGVFRIVIACTPDTMIDVVTIPKKIAHTLFIEETATPFNIHILQKYVDNHTDYPGCNNIKSIDRGTLIINSGNYKLNFGDVVFRNVIDGDILVDNRSPSNDSTSFTAAKIKVYDGIGDISCKRMNIGFCKGFNADFDGDSMTGKVVKSEAIREEARQLLDINMFMLNYGSASPIVGQQQDAIPALAQLTKSDTIISRYDVMFLYERTPIRPILKKEYYTGREVFSMSLPVITYRAASPMFKDPLVKLFGDFDESDYIVNIEKGVLKSGIICGDIIKEKPGSLYSVIMSQYGMKTCLDTVFHNQQLAMNFNKMYGLTMSYSDLLLNDESKMLIDRIKTVMYREFDELNNQLVEGTLKIPKDKTTQQYIEDRIAKISNVNKSFISAIMKSIDLDTNGLFKMVLTGSKGKLSNILNIYAFRGQLKINNLRLRNTLDYQRFSIYSPQFSIDPRHRGLVSQSYIEGLDPQDVPAIGMETRRNILTKGIVTSVAGSSGRTKIIMMESLIVSNLLMTSRGYNQKIVEFSCCDDGFKPSIYQLVKLPILRMSNSEIKRKYKTRSDKIIQDRDYILDIHNTLTILNPYFTFNDKIYLPIDVSQIILNVDGDNSTVKGMQDKEKLLDEFCDSIINYLRFHPVFRAKGRKVPPYVINQFKILSSSIRCLITPEFLETISIDTFKLLLNDISRRIIDTFFNPGEPIGTIIGQAYTGPLTQYLIDAHHASTDGGTSRDNLEYSDSVLNNKDIKSSSITKMIVFVKPEYEQDHKIVQEVADKIYTKKLKNMLTTTMIYYEGINENIFDPEDAEFIKKNKSFIKGDLYPVKIKMYLRKHIMKEYGITFNDIANRIDYIYDSKIIAIDTTKSTSSNYEILLLFDIDFNWRFSSSRDIKSLKKPISTNNKWSLVDEFAKKFFKETTINEFTGIKSSHVLESKKYIIENGEVKEYKFYFIETDGIDMRNVLRVNIVDNERTYCRNAIEMYKYGGFFACKQTMINELQNTFGESIGFMPSCYAIISNLVMETGTPSPLSEIGLKQREPDELLLRMAYRNVQGCIVEGAVNNTTTSSNALLSNIIMGQKPKTIGTTYNKIIVNEQFVIDNAKKSEDIEDYL